jgi:hypothetical protein
MPGTDGEPFFIDTASGRSRPARIMPMTVGAVEKATCVSPASTDCIAGPPPLNCTCVRGTPTAAENSVAEMFGVEPKPAEATNSLLGFALA